MLAKLLVGVLEGSGPHKDETIVIGAHYDHVGYGNGGGGFGGGSTFGGIGAFGSPVVREAAKMVHHGADDNASGTVSVIELARRFAEHPERRGRRLVFIAFTAEESGLIGSQYYARHPVFPLEKTVAMVNFDMIGRLQDDLAAGARAYPGGPTRSRGGPEDNGRLHLSRPVRRP